MLCVRPDLARQECSDGKKGKTRVILRGFKGVVEKWKASVENNYAEK
jgi:hypothetical protein